MVAERHQHQKAAGNGNIRRHSCPFGADRGFYNLNEDLHAGTEDIGDIGDGVFLSAASLLQTGFAGVVFCAFFPLGLNILVVGMPFIVIIVHVPAL